MPNIRPRQVKTFGELQAGITPMVPGQPERIPWTWFDSQTYTSGTTTSLDFFNSVQANKVNGNMEAAGQIPAPQFFDIYHIGIRPLLAPDAITDAAALLATGAINDMHALLSGSAELLIAQKSYYRAPIFLCPAGAGVHGMLAAAATFTAEQADTVTYANNGVPDLRNRNNFWGDITIPHNQNFVLRLEWAAAITLAAGDTVIRPYLDGFLYRRVL